MTGYACAGYRSSLGYLSPIQCSHTCSVLTFVVFPVLSLFPRSQIRLFTIIRWVADSYHILITSCRTRHHTHAYCPYCDMSRRLSIGTERAEMRKRARKMEMDLPGILHCDLSFVCRSFLLCVDSRVFHLAYDLLDHSHPLQTLYTPSIRAPLHQSMSMLFVSVLLPPSFPVQPPLRSGPSSLVCLFL